MLVEKLWNVVQELTKNDEALLLGSDISIEHVKVLANKFWPVVSGGLIIEN